MSSLLMHNDDEKNLTMTVGEAAKILKIGRNQAYEAARSGEIPAMRIGGRLLVLTMPLRRMLNGDTPQASLAKDD